MIVSNGVRFSVAKPVVHERKKSFVTKKGVPIPDVHRKQPNEKLNRYEKHLLTMEVDDCVQNLDGAEVAGFRLAAKKFGMKVPARCDPPNGLLYTRQFTVWRIE